MLGASHTVSLFSGCLAGSGDSQKGHPRRSDGHCLGGLAGRVMVGPRWGQGKPGPVLLSDVQGVQELFVGPTSLSVPFTACRFSCRQVGGAAWAWLPVTGVRLFADPSERTGARAPPTVLRATSAPFPLKEPEGGRSGWRLLKVSRLGKLLSCAGLVLKGCSGSAGAFISFSPESESLLS